MQRQHDPLQVLEPLSNRLFEFAQLEGAGPDRRVSLGPCRPWGTQRKE